MTDRELMQQALETLDRVMSHGSAVQEAKDILRERLAQPNDFNPDWDAMAVMVEEQQRMAKRIAELEAQSKQEPVAWADEIIDDLHAQYNTDGIKEIDSGDALIRLDEAIAAVEEAEKRHTAPPQRKPLTEEEIEVLAKKHNGIYYECDITFARAIEAAHGIKENT